VATERLVATRPTEAAGQFFMGRLWAHMTPSARYTWVPFMVVAVQNGPAAIWVRERQPWEVDQDIVAALLETVQGGGQPS